MRGARHFNVGVTLLLGALALSVAVTAFIAARKETADPDFSTNPGLATPCGGTEVSLAEAGRSASFTLIKPNAPAANSDNLRSAWECTTTAGGIALVYGSGVSVLEAPNDLEDPAATWKRMADLYKEFSVKEIHGIPVSIADPAVGAIGGADFVVGSVRYAVSGNGKIPLDDLLPVAESLAGQVTK